MQPIVGSVSGVVLARVEVSDAHWLVAIIVTTNGSTPYWVMQPTLTYHYKCNYMNANIIGEDYWHMGLKK